MASSQQNVMALDQCGGLQGLGVCLTREECPSGAHIRAQEDRRVLKGRANESWAPSRAGPSIH